MVRNWKFLNISHFDLNAPKWPLFEIKMTGHFAIQGTSGRICKVWYPDSGCLVKVKGQGRHIGNDVAIQINYRSLNGEWVTESQTNANCKHLWSSNTFKSSKYRILIKFLYFLRKFYIFWIMCCCSLGGFITSGPDQVMVVSGWGYTEVGIQIDGLWLADQPQH